MKNLFDEVSTAAYFPGQWIIWMLTLHLGEPKLQWKNETNTKKQVTNNLIERPLYLRWLNKMLRLYLLIESTHHLES